MAATRHSPSVVMSCVFIPSDGSWALWEVMESGMQAVGEVAGGQTASPQKIRVSPNPWELRTCRGLGTQSSPMQ